MRFATKLIVDHLKAFASDGLTMAEAAEKTGMAYGSIAQYASKYDITFTRQIMAERPAGRARAQDMRQRYEDGETLEQIGQRYNVTRERVRQILSKKFGTTARDGGSAEQARRKRREFHKKRDARCLRQWGCTYRQYVGILKHDGKPTYIYAQQRKNAMQREIGWELTLWQWWKIWQQSGHWELRGRGADGYGMCRLNDIGPYSVDNVYIATCSENMKDYWANKRAQTSQVEAAQ